MRWKWRRKELGKKKGERCDAQNGRIFQCSWLRMVLKSQFLRLLSCQVFALKTSVCIGGVSVIDYTLAVVCLSGLGVLTRSRIIRRNLQYGLRSVSVDRVRTPV